jgi:hypothetical protein
LDARQLKVRCPKGQFRGRQFLIGDSNLHISAFVKVWKELNCTKRPIKLAAFLLNEFWRKMSWSRLLAFDMNYEGKVLTSWKEIAAYLGKGVRTVQRWEQTLGLPVQRPNGKPKGIVFAACDELDKWLATNWARRLIETTSSFKTQRANDELEASIREFRRLRQSNRELSRDLRRSIHTVKAKSDALARTMCLYGVIRRTLPEKATNSRAKKG